MVYKVLLTSISSVIADVVLLSGRGGEHTVRELEDSPLSGRFLSSNDSSSVRSPWFISPGRKDVKCQVMKSLTKL